MKRLGLILLSLAIVSGCTSQPAQQEQKQPPESVTGRTGFQKLYVAARGWASDVRPYQLQSQAVAMQREQTAKLPSGVPRLAPQPSTALASMCGLE